MHQAIMRYGLTKTELYGLRVGIFRNLTRNCYSVKAYQGEHKGKVIAYLPLDAAFELSEAEFRVGEKTRDRVRAERKKYIHVMVVGYLQDVSLSNPDFRVTYNPYTHNYFQTRINGQDYEVFKSDAAVFTGRQVYASGSLNCNELGAVA